MSVPAHWRELNNEQRQLVERYIKTLLKEQDELDLPAKPGREIVERKIANGVCYQLELVKCGKPKCKCAIGKAHGPYWYAYFRQDGKLKSKYIGKVLVRS